jgi:hypothetical protein
LELEIEARVRVREAARETNRVGAWEQRRSGVRMSETEREALRGMLTTEQLEKEKVIAGELERDVERVIEEWRVRLQPARVRREDR